MMQGDAFIFFMIFALTLAGMYISLRRNWFKTEIVAAVGTIVSITAMVLSILESGTSVIQALFFGILIGAIFSGAILAMAWYFHSNELRGKYMTQDGDRQTDERYA